MNMDHMHQIKRSLIEIHNILVHSDRASEAYFADAIFVKLN